MLRILIQKGQYHDSVVLMLLTGRLAQLNGVKRVSVMMGTPANKEMFRQNGMDAAELAEAGPDDMMIGVETEGAEFPAGIYSAMEQFFREMTAAGEGEKKTGVNSWKSAGQQFPEANLALISVPGAYASFEAERALNRGLHVFLFSDNVAVEDEARLKKLAHEKGLLLMGPDCGTALIGGVPLGFSHQVKPGGIGIAGASGTGIQELISVISRYGEGISHALGTGGRDLYPETGAITMLDAVSLLAQDEQTKVLVVISKPPAKPVREMVVNRLRQIDKPIVMLFMGECPARTEPDFYQAYTLEEAAAAAVQLVRGEQPRYQPKAPLPKYLTGAAAGKKIKGLFCGGTLAYEAAMLIGCRMSGKNGCLCSPAGHEIIDLGDDAYTCGRPHPMLDPGQRLEYLKQAVADSGIGVILFDVMLGWGAHEKMTEITCSYLQQAQQELEKAGRKVYFAAVLCGTDRDEQGYERQRRRLKEAGVFVFDSNRQAAVAALLFLGEDYREPDKTVTGKRSVSGGRRVLPASLTALLTGKLNILNMGLAGFAGPPRQMGAKVVDFHWRPPAGGDGEMMRILEFLSGQDEANRAVAEKIRQASGVLTDVVLAGQVIPELNRGQVLLHAGPPLTWPDMPAPMQGSCIGAALFEGWAKDEEQAVNLLESGAVSFIPCHHVNAVGPMGGITSAHMPVFVVQCMPGGNEAYCTMNEGIGKVLRFGAYSAAVVERLNWMRHVLGPVLGEAIRKKPGGIPLQPLVARALAMGDEFHQRNIAASALFLREVAPLLGCLQQPRERIAGVLGFLAETDQFFLNLMMAYAKAVMDYAKTEVRGTVVTAMCRNGYEFGIRISGMGDEWFTAPVNTPQGLYFSGYTGADASPDMGDSAITESFGVGGMAMIAAPAVTRFVGTGGFWDALETSNQMKEICVGQNPALAIPAWDFQGICVGIDARLVVESGITPVINTGIAHRRAGVGQIGAGTVRPPLECFKKALQAYAKKLGFGGT